MIETNTKPILISELESYYQGFLEFKRATELKWIVNTFLNLSKVS